MRISAANAVRRAGIERLHLDVDGVTIRPMPDPIAGVVGRRIAAITVVRTVFVRPDLYESLIEGREPALLVHELTHVYQWRRDGVIGFLARYVSEYLRLRLIGVGHDAAYRGVIFEHAAYDAADRFEQRVA